MNCERCGLLKRAARPAFTFVSERGAPFTVAGLGKLIERAGVAAKIGFKVASRTSASVALGKSNILACRPRGFRGRSPDVMNITQQVQAESERFLGYAIGCPKDTTCRHSQSLLLTIPRTENAVPPTPIKSSAMAGNAKATLMTAASFKVLNMLISTF
jgi:hypothetical protein